MKILLAMSGGVDSSVVAHLLKAQGHEIIAVRFNLWTDPLAPAIAKILPSKCCTTQNISRASTVCKELGIPLKVIDLEDEFKESVVDPYLAAHAKGLTPNPCIGCNRSIKFGKLLTLRKELGCDRLATGHYARTALETLSDGSKRMLLLEGIDPKKDQSYYLYALSQEQLGCVFFPLGGMMKSEVYALAKEFGVPISGNYRESQDLCFFPEKEPSEFLKRHLSSSIEPGPIVRRDGSLLGTHHGLPLYTVGQRHGLGVGGLKIPLEVVKKDVVGNTLIVADRGSETVSEVGLSEVHFVSAEPDGALPTQMECRTRSLSKRKKGSLLKRGTQWSFRFEKPEAPQSPGQSLVLYRGEEVVGGGVMQ